MEAKLVCDYCHRSDQKDLYMITLTGIRNTKNTCSKIICPRCAYHIQTLLDGILDKRDIDETLKEIEGDIIGINGTTLEVKEVAHVLKAYKHYLGRITHCAFDERTAQWIIDNWDSDYSGIEGMPTNE